MGRRARRSHGIAQAPPAWSHRQERDAAMAIRADLRNQGIADLWTLALETRYEWIPCGPAGISQPPGGEHWQGADPTAGLVMDISVDSAGNDLHIATTDGGVWHSADGGVNWTPLTDRRRALGVGAVARSTGGANPVLFSGTGDPHDEGAFRAHGGGLERSIDGGRTWHRIGGRGAANLALRDVNAIVAFDENRLLVATDAGLFYSADGGINFGAAPAYDDGTPVAPGLVNWLKASGTEFWFSVATDGIYKGQVPPTAANIQIVHRPASVVPATAATPIGNIVFDRILNAGTERFLASTARQNPSGTQYHSMQVGFGGTWRRLPHTALDRNQTAYNHCVALDPADPRVAYVGMVSMYAATNLNTTPNPPTWTPANVSNSKLHADQHRLLADANRGGPRTRMYAGNDGGVYRTDNAGGAWSGLNRRLETNLLYGIALARNAAGNLEMVAGMQDTGTADGSTAVADPSVSSDWTWAYASGGDGGAVLIDPADPDNAWGWANETLMRRRLVGGSRRWTSTGFSVTGDAFASLLALGRNAAGNWRDLYVAAFVRLPGNTWRGRLYKSTNGGASAPALKKTFPLRITAMTVAPTDASQETNASPPAWKDVWLGFIDGTVQVNRNGGTGAFTTFSPGGAGPVLGIAVDPTNSQRVAVVYAGYTGLPGVNRTQHVYLTDDGGTNWRDIGGQDGSGPAGNVPDLPCLAVMFVRSNPGLLLVGLEGGVVATEGPNYGQVWRRVALGLPNVAVTSLAQVANAPGSAAPALGAALPPIVAGTYGRSVFRLRRTTGRRLVIHGELGFEPTTAGAPAERRRLVLANPGDAELSLTTIGSPGGVFRVVSPPAVPRAIPAGGSLPLEVEVDPTGDGRHTAVLVLESNDPANPRIEVPMSADVRLDAVPHLALSHRALNFGPGPGGARTLPVVLRNLGRPPLNVTAIDRTGDASFSMVAADGTTALTFPIVLGPRETRTVRVRFDPGENGERQARFTVRSNDPTSTATPAVIRVAGERVSAGLSAGEIALIVAGVAVVVGAVVTVAVVASQD